MKTNSWIQTLVKTLLKPLVKPFSKHSAHSKRHVFFKQGRVGQTTAVIVALAVVACFFLKLLKFPNANLCFPQKQPDKTLSHVVRPKTEKSPSNAVRSFKWFSSGNFEPWLAKNLSLITNDMVVYHKPFSVTTNQFTNNSNNLFRFQGTIWRNRKTVDLSWKWDVNTSLVRTPSGKLTCDTLEFLSVHRLPFSSQMVWNKICNW